MQQQHGTRQQHQRDQQAAEALGGKAFEDGDAGLRREQGERQDHGQGQQALPVVGAIDGEQDCRQSQDRGVEALQHPAALFLAPVAHGQPHGRQRAGQAGHSPQDPAQEANGRIDRRRRTRDSRQAAPGDEEAAVEQQQTGDDQLQDLCADEAQDLQADGDAGQRRQQKDRQPAPGDGVADKIEPLKAAGYRHDQNHGDGLKRR